MPDANLRKIVRSTLGIAEGSPLTQEALAGPAPNRLEHLIAHGSGISDLTGLEHADYLSSLWLNDNHVSDLSPLRNLKMLVILTLENNKVSDLSPLSDITSLERLDLDRNKISDLSPLEGLENLIILKLWYNNISNITVLSKENHPKLYHLGLRGNNIEDIANLGDITTLAELYLGYNNRIRNIAPVSTLTELTSLYVHGNQVSNIAPLSTLTKLRYLLLSYNKISSISNVDWSKFTDLQWLYINNNLITELPDLSGLTDLTRLYMHCNPISNFESVAALTNLPKLTMLRLNDDDTSEELAVLSDLDEIMRLLGDCAGDPGPEPKPEVKRRRYINQCGLGWSPQPQYHYRGELPKVMMYALEFEYDPESQGKYICKTIEIRTGDDTIENLAGWKLYLGTRYNPSSVPLTIPEEHSQIADRVLRITPEMLGLETFPCNTVYVNGISHPLPGVHYVLKTDENILVDTAYSCFIWGQNAYTTVNGVNVESPRRV